MTPPRLLMARKGGGWSTRESTGLVNGFQVWNHPTMSYMDFIGFRTWRNTRQTPCATANPIHSRPSTSAAL